MLRFLLAYLALSCAAVAVAQTPQLPDWAYVINPHAGAPAAKDETPRHVPGSEATFTTAQIADLFSPPDWHPSAHPAMPAVVAHGRKPDVFACGYCHLPNGAGRPENASLAGLPAGYLVQQMADFKSGARKNPVALHLPAANMIKIANAASDEEIAAAAQYFSHLSAKPWIRVVESATVPKTSPEWMLIPDAPATREPIGHRIIEVPEDPQRCSLRDDTSGFVAYVPPGSIQKGKMLATTGGSGKTVACGTCHGPGLRGTGKVPAIAGRSPSYIVRQLYNIKIGARSGTASQQMLAPVTQLEPDDIIALAAYVASLRP